jgi:hypothetical protein
VQEAMTKANDVVDLSAIDYFQARRQLLAEKKPGEEPS